MLNELFELVKPEHRLTVMKQLFDCMQDLNGLSNHYFLKDPETKNIAIDYMCALLDSQKTTPKELQ